jgi:endo-1,3-1,4-beta-glycanase ExoK
MPSFSHWAVASLDLGGLGRPDHDRHGDREPREYPARPASVAGLFQPTARTGDLVEKRQTPKQAERKSAQLEASRPKKKLAHAAFALVALLGASLPARDAVAKSYKGAEIVSTSQHLYGRIEVRMRMARGPGILSTFFTYKPGSEMAGAQWEEIDIEALGKSNATAWQSNILVGNPRAGSEMVHDSGSSLADAYHTFTIEWTPGLVVWKVDGVESRRTSGGQANQLTSMHNFHFNLWASDVSSWAGAFDSSMLPASQYVSWIRYYKYDSGSFVLDWSDDFATFDAARWEKANWTFDGNLVDFEPNNAIVKDGTLVLCLTAQAQTGCSGTVPVDSQGSLGGGGGGAGGAGGAGGGANGGGGASGAAAGGTGGTPVGGSGGVSAGGSGIGGAGGAAGGATAGAGGATAQGGNAAVGGASTTGGQGGQALGGSSSSVGGTAPSGAPAVAGASAVGGTQAVAGTNGTVADPGCGCAVPSSESSGRRLPGALALLGALTALLRRRSARSAG